MDTISMPLRGICAHRGETETHPENTLVAFRRAIAMGAHQIEFDVQLSKDGYPVVMHDPTVDRTTDGTGPLCELTFDEIRALDAGAWKDPAFKGEQVPTLEEALSVMPRNIWLNVHLKVGRDVGVIAAEEVCRQNRQHQAFLAAAQDGIQGARSVFPNILLCNMERQGADASQYVAITIRNRCHFMQCWRALPSPADLAKLREAGVRLNLFPFNEPAKLTDTLAGGIDFPLTDTLTDMMAAAADLGIAPVAQTE